MKRDKQRDKNKYNSYICSIMSIKTNIPQISALCTEVENKMGRDLHTHADFLMLVDAIEEELREHVSETTLERLWGYSTRKSDAVSLRTLNVIAKFLNYAGWIDYCDSLKLESNIESEMFAADVIMSDALEVGERLKIGWQPDRVCEVRYLGDNRFIAEATVNSSIKPGDTFSCLMFQLGRELYMDDFLKNGQEPSNVSQKKVRYVVGQKNGLTTLEHII